MPGNDGGTQLRNQQRNQRERGDFDEIGEAHRQAEAHQFAHRRPLRWLPAMSQAIGGERPAAQQVDHAAGQGKPVDQRVRDATADDTQPGLSVPAIDQQPGQHAVQQGCAERDAHQRPGLAKGIAEGIKGAVAECRRDTPGMHHQIGTRLGLHLGLNLRQGQQRIRMPQQQDAGNRQQQRQPEALLQGGGNFRVTPGPFELGDHRRHGVEDAGERKSDRHVDATTHRDGRQIAGAVMTEQGRVDHHHAHRRQLGDQHRHGVVQDQA